MRIGLIRHGETDWNAAGRLQGTTDIPLNDRGVGQAEDAASFVDADEWAAVYCSPLQRTRDTAAFFATAIGADAPRILPEVIERSFGELEGEFVYREDGTRTDLNHPTVEPEGAVVDRVLAALRKLARVHPDEHVLVITHGSVVRLVLQEVLGRKAPRISNLGYSELETVDAPSGFVVRVANGYPLAR